MIRDTFVDIVFYLIARQTGHPVSMVLTLHCLEYLKEYSAGVCRKCKCLWSAVGFSSRSRARYPGNGFKAAAAWIMQKQPVMTTKVVGETEIVVARRDTIVLSSLESHGAHPKCTSFWDNVGNHGYEVTRTLVPPLLRNIFYHSS